MNNYKRDGQNGIRTENISRIWRWRTNIYDLGFTEKHTKKGDRMECRTYRDFLTLDVGLSNKVFVSYLKVKIEKVIEPHLGWFSKREIHNWSNFYGEREIAILLWFYEYEIPAAILFVYFRSVYDTVKSSKLLEEMKEFEIPQKLINLTKMTYDQ